ncbi:NAD(P)/FAD-dependent oxidoreductase [uncultured Sphingomonas sp.]|uniref:NAD(P)/FAD-dependent oxidoreductase n=1 Tax=uncultured Sphingomonas sp. TaxID=158754 RepID=UPI0035C94AF7
MRVGPMRVGIVGAGMAGLSCADALAAAGHQPTLFDKGRGPGGRMSTRRVELDGRTLTFDHGAQYMTARDPAFVARVGAWEITGVAARWPAAGPDAWVGVPGMSAPVRALAAAHDVRWTTRIEALRRKPTGWTLEGTDDDPFDAVVVALPAEQAAPLLARHHPAFAATAAASRTLPCWTVMAAFAEPLPGVPDTIKDAGPIGWAARDGAKPGRAGTESWVIQAAPDWSQAYLEEAPDTVASALFALFAQHLGTDLPEPVHLMAHRWRFARSRPPADAPGALWDAEARLGVCGDWLLAPPVEAAWLSGQKLVTLIAP